jgi:dihydrofolate reductase
MGTVGAGFSMSLDGFIADPKGEVGPLFDWMFSGSTDMKLSAGDHDIDLKMSEPNVEHFEDMLKTVGAIVSGRGMFDEAKAWGGKHPMDVPVFVVTHNPPREWINKESPFTFVTDGVASAVALAQKAAGKKSVGVGGADVARQCLQAGLLDDIGIDLVPILLGKGIRLFEYMGIEPIKLEASGVTYTPGVTHLSFRVVK